MPCYILQAGATDMVKIGWADSDVEGRRRELQCAHYEALSVIRVIECESFIERLMHRRFADRRVRGEWFRFSPEMLTVSVEKIRSTWTPPTYAEPIPLTDQIEAFLGKSGMSATAFGIQAASDPTLVHEMRKGRECKRAIRTRIAEFIASQEAA